MSANANVRRSAWREPMLWLVAALPVASVVAGIALVGVIARGGNVDTLGGNVRRTAQIQAEDTRADEEALRRGLHATVQRDPARGGLLLEMQGDTGDLTALQLQLLHPVSATQDRELWLERIDARHWHAADWPLAANAWHLRLQPADRRWRLAGRLDAAAQRVEMEPLWRP